MKRVACLFLLFLMFFTTALANTEELPIITYEKMQAGNYKGDEFRVIAKPVKGTLFGRPVWMWYVENREGNFQSVDGGYDWIIDEREFEQLSEDHKLAVTEKKEFVLTVYTLGGGGFYVREFEIYTPPVRNADVDDMSSMIGCIALFACCVIIFVVLYRQAKKKEESGEFERERAEYAEERERRRLSRTIVKTKILDSYSNSTTSGRTSTTSAIGRGIVGGMIAGPLGAAVGAGTAKRNYNTRETRTVIFKVWYADGHDEIKHVSQGTYDYNKFIEKLED